MSHMLKQGRGYNHTEDEQAEVVKAWHKILSCKLPVVEFKPEWHNGTGYFDKACIEDMPAPFRFTDEHGRIGIVFELSGSHFCIFQRYSDDPDVVATCHVIDWKKRRKYGLADHFLIALFMGRPGANLVESIAHKLEMESRY